MDIKSATALTHKLLDEQKTAKPAKGAGVGSDAPVKGEASPSEAGDRVDVSAQGASLAAKLADSNLLPPDPNGPVNDEGARLISLDIAQRVQSDSGGIADNAELAILNLLAGDD